jgi:catechol 1,2-dioxygenase
LERTRPWRDGAEDIDREAQVSDRNERVTTVAMDVIAAIKERLVAHGVTQQEYRQAWAWLIGLAESGEVPLFLDVHFEAAVERAAAAGRPGSEGAVLGPFHLEGQQQLSEPYRLPMRDDEPGTPFLFEAVVQDLDGAPIADVEVDVWQSAGDSLYSGFGSDAPAGNLRGLLRTGADGVARFATVRPAPYQIPNQGPTGEFLRMTGRHDWRPAHFHFILAKPGFETLITQIYFAGDPIIDGEGDVVDAVKDSLIIEVGKGEEAAVSATYGIAVPYETGAYTFVLRPAG